MRDSWVIVERELLALLRTNKALAILLAVALGFALVVLLKWPTSALVGLSGSQPRQVFQALSYAMLTAAILIVPVFPATSLVREVKQHTLQLLLHSPLSRTSIYLGKMGAMLGFIVMLLFATLPAMACCYAMGGVSFTGEILKLYGFLFVVCTQLVVVGLLVGTYSRSSEGALRWAYGVTFGLVVIPVIPDLFLRGSASMFATAASSLKLLSPIPALLQLVNHSSVGGAGMMESRDAVSIYLMLALAFIVLGSLFCIFRLSHHLLDRSRSQGIITDDQSAGVRAARRVFFLIDPQRRKSGIPPLVNPVMVKEFRSRQFGRLHWLLRLIAGCAIMSLLLTLATTLGTVDWGVKTMGGIIIILQVSLIVLLTPGLAGGMIAGEIEGGGWNLLRTTPLRPGKILSGKLISVCITLAFILCATLPGYAIIMKIKPVLYEQVTQVLISLVLAALLSMLVSATVSSFFRTTTAATTVSYAILISLYAGTMLVWLNRDAPFSHSFVRQTLMFNPMATALSAIQTPGFEGYDLVPTGWWTTGAMCLGLLIILYIRIWRLSRPD